MTPHADSDAFPLLEYVDKLVDQLRKLIPKAIKAEDVDAVHDARVATRRLKAAVDLVDPVVTRRCKRPFLRVTRTLRRQLGPLRDLDVMLEHLEQIKQPRFGSASAWMKTRLHDQRAKLLTEAARQAPPARVLVRLGAWWGLRQEIADAHEAIDSLLAQAVHLQLDAFIEQAGQLHRPPGAQAPAGDPHQLRIAGKSLRYTLEMAKEHGCRLARAVMPRFKRMQESLGLWHDYVVLSQCMLQETIDCDLALHNWPLHDQVTGLARWTMRQSQINLERVARLWAERGQQMAEQIRAAFPLTKPVVETQMPATPPPAATADESTPSADAENLPAA